MRRRLRLSLLFACGLFAAAPVRAQTLGQGQGVAPTVFAAASLKSALDEATGAFSGPAPRLSYGGSLALVRQIAQGAPADLLCTADSETMDDAQTQGLIAPASRVDLFGNALVLVAPARAPFEALALEADALARSALANYFAGAVMAPYARFHAAAKAVRYDVDVLRHRFGLSFEQTCHRLTTLRRPGQEGVPFHLTRVDIAGNISKRFSASGIHIARFGAACPRWNVYDAFTTPGMLRVQVSRMPDGSSFFCIARTIEAPARAASRGGLPSRVGQQAVGLGCALPFARELVYADGLSLDDPQIVTPIGVTCRTCPRTDCSDRALPSLSQKLEIDENRRGLSTYAVTD